MALSRNGRQGHRDLYVRFSQAHAELMRVEAVVSAHYAKLHALTTTWGRPGDEGRDEVSATAVEAMIRESQSALVAALTALHQSAKEREA